MAGFDDFSESMVRGDTHRFVFVVTLEDVAQDITLWKRFWYTVKSSVKKSDEDALFQLTDAEGGGITRSDPTHGVLLFTISPEHTEGVSASRRDKTYYADIQGVDAQDNVSTLARGTFILSADVTQSREVTL